MPDTLSQVFSALADPTRRAILARLKLGEANVADLAEPFLRDMTRPAISKHLKVLERAGLVTRGREAQWRPCKLNPKPLRDASGWMEEYREAWEQSLDRLGEYLKTVTSKAATTKTSATKSTPAKRTAKRSASRNAASRNTASRNTASRKSVTNTVTRKPKRDR